jgi:hypothetical protein
MDTLGASKALRWLPSAVAGREGGVISGKRLRASPLRGISGDQPISKAHETGVQPRD